MSTAADFWMRVEAWAGQAGLPAGLLRAPATAAQLEALDEGLLTGCPDELQALLALHNGAGHGWFCFSGGHFLSSEEILSEVAERRRNARELFDVHAGSPECLGAVRPLWWSESWVPFMRRNKEPVCIDLAPQPGGSQGQIIEIDWEGRTNRVLDDGLSPFLQRVMDELGGRT